MVAEEIIAANLNDNWKNTYSLAFMCTKETKLREFQFKLLDRRIATNDFLHKIGLKPIDSCTFCGETIENRIHLFWKSNILEHFGEKPISGYVKTLMALKIPPSLQPYVLA